MDATHKVCLKTSPFDRCKCRSFFDVLNAHGALFRALLLPFRFKAAVQFNNNHADFEFDGGGVSVSGGDVV